VGEIDYRCQFHKRFLHVFFVQIFGTKPNITRENDVRTKNLYAKRWWNWLQEIRRSKNLLCLWCQKVNYRWQFFPTFTRRELEKLYVLFFAEDESIMEKNSVLTRFQFHSYFTSCFSVNIILPKTTVSIQKSCLKHFSTNKTARKMFNCQFTFVQTVCFCIFWQKNNWLKSFSYNDCEINYRFKRSSLTRRHWRRSHRRPTYLSSQVEKYSYPRKNKFAVIYDAVRCIKTRLIVLLKGLKVQRIRKGRSRKQVSISPNCLSKAFMYIDHRSAKKTVKSSVILHFLDLFV